MKFEYPSQLPVSAARSDIAEDSVGIGPWIAW